MKFLFISYTSLCYQKLRKLLYETILCDLCFNDMWVSLRHRSHETVGKNLDTLFFLVWRLFRVIILHEKYFYNLVKQRKRKKGV